MPWGPRPYRNWSMGCVDEISSGKLVEASTLADLAERIGVEADVLERSVQMFNAAAESGEDAYGREAATMTAFGEGPYYAFEVFPSILNTQGGAERTAQGEIVGMDGKPIPHLYSAGEFGGVNSNKYQGGSNIAECIVFGKISGEHAAAAKDDVQLDIDEQSVEYKIGSGDVSAYQQTPDESALSTGEVYGIGEGLGGPIWVKAAGSDGAITALEIVRATETEGVGTAAYEPVVAAIVESGGVDVDTVSGATMTSKGIIEAAGDALSKL